MPKTDTIQVAFKKLQHGDSMTDHEVNALVDHFQALVDLLTPLGAPYYLASHDALDRLNQVRGYQAARRRGL